MFYNNGLFKPLKIESESEFNDSRMFFKTYETNGLISYYIDENQKKYFVFKNKFYEFDEFELLENGFTIFEKGEKYAVLDDTRTYFSDFKFEDVSFDSSTIMEFAFKQNGKWGLMSSSFDYEFRKTIFKIKLEPVYKSSKELFEK